MSIDVSNSLYSSRPWKVGASHSKLQGVALKRRPRAHVLTSAREEISETSSGLSLDVVEEPIRIERIEAMPNPLGLMLIGSALLHTTVHTVVVWTEKGTPKARGPWSQFQPY